MFCPNCGHKINEHEQFCSKCGKNKSEITIDLSQNNKSKEINNSKNIDIENNQETLSQKLAKNNMLIPILTKIEIILTNFKKYILNHKMPLAIISSFLIVIVLGLLLFNQFYDFTKISWDTESGDANVTYTQPTTLTLNVLAFDKNKNKINDIKFDANGGEIINDGCMVKWKLPKENGTYKIFAESPSGKKIEKEIRVVLLNENNDISLGGIIELPLDKENLDSDNDGILDVKEIELGTDPYSADTDEDGLPDKLEMEQSNTDPLKKDTD